MQGTSVSGAPQSNAVRAACRSCERLNSDAVG